MAETKASVADDQGTESTQADADKARDKVEADAKKAGVNFEDAPVGVESITTVTPAEADKSSLPNAMDAKPEDPPVRASRPATPIAQTLAAGAGEHTPPDPAEFDKEGRPRPK